MFQHGIRKRHTLAQRPHKLPARPQISLAGYIWVNFCLKLNHGAPRTRLKGSFPVEQSPGADAPALTGTTKIIVLREPHIIGTTTGPCTRVGECEDGDRHGWRSRVVSRDLKASSHRFSSSSSNCAGSRRSSADQACTVKLPIAHTAHCNKTCAPLCRCAWLGYACCRQM